MRRESIIVVGAYIFLVVLFGIVISLIYLTTPVEPPVVSEPNEPVTEGKTLIEFYGSYEIIAREPNLIFDAWDIYGKYLDVPDSPVKVPVKQRVTLHRSYIITVEEPNHIKVVERSTL